MVKRWAIYVLLCLAAFSLSACGGNAGPTLEPPSNLTATADAGFIRLSWQDNSDNETAFFIYREVAGGAAAQAFDKIGEVGANVESFEDDRVSPEQNYRYAVAAKNDASITEPVPQAGPALSPDAPITNNPPVIADFRATPAEGNPPLTVRLSWSISDSDAEALSCAVDIGDNGTVEYRFEDCSSEDEQEHTFEGAGNFIVSLSVSDGKEEVQETTEVDVFVSLQ